MMLKPKLSRFIVFLCSGILLLATEIAVHASEYQVSRVIDGDTIEIKKGTIKLTVRLVGIDAPETPKKKHEPGQPFSQQSAKYLAKLTLNRSADVKSYGTDRYGRVLGEVFVDGNNVNLEMVKVGLAEVYRGTPARGQDVRPYWSAEEMAQKMGNGIWAQGNKYISPKQWRKVHQN